MNTTAQASSDTTKTTAPKPGIYPDVPFADYLRWGLLSQSTLKVGRTSMAHLKAALDGQSEIEVTDSMTLGSALDCAFLEPEHMFTKVAVWEGQARKGAAWLDFCEQHAGKALLTVNAFRKLQGMLKSLRKHPEVRKWLGQIEEVQCSIVGDIEGVPFKVRLDALTPDPILDLKMTADGDPRIFARNAYDMGYHIQAYCYCRLAKRERMVLMTVENEPPYDVLPYKMDQWMEVGERETLDLIRRYKACLANDDWPGRSREPIDLEVPNWVVEKHLPAGSPKLKF